MTSFVKNQPLLAIPPYVILLLEKLLQIRLNRFNRISLSHFTKKKPNLPKPYPSAARPSYLHKTRHFPPPPHGRFGFVEIYSPLVIFTMS